MTRATAEATARELDGIKDPEELMGRILKNFGRRAAVGTSGQFSGTVLIDIASKTGLPYRVFTVDTERLLPLTHTHFGNLENRYKIEIERYYPAPERVAKMIAQHGEFLFFDTKAKQEFCCYIRKTLPNREALKTLDVWITGLRRDQSESRQTTPRAVIDETEGRPIIKVNPLVDWTRKDVEAYVKSRHLPYHFLYDQGYESIGCEICTTPQLPHEQPRAGRWRWFNNRTEAENKECGIHLPGVEKAPLPAERQEETGATGKAGAKPKA